MPSIVWKGLLSFGLVSIPVKLYAAARAQRFALHQLHKKCHTRLKQPLYCPTCERFVERSEVVKGYEYEKGKYVLVDSDEIKRITPASAKTMEILAFVKTDQVDPIYFESSFLSVPDEEGRKGYHLLVKALEAKDMMGIAKLTMHQREYTVFVRPRSHGLTLHTMYYTNEIASVKEYGASDNIKVTPPEVKLAEQLVETLAADFKPERYRDEFQEQLGELIAAKLKGKKVEVVAAGEAPRAPVIDIMEALKRSLAAREPGKVPAAAPAAKRGRRKAG